MKVYITNDVEQDCKNLISMYTDLKFIKTKIIEAYKNLSQAKQTSVSKKIQSHIVQALGFLNDADDNILISPLSLFYSINNFSKAIYLIKYPNLSLSGAHGLNFNTQITKDIIGVGEIKCDISGKGTFLDLIAVTGDLINKGNEFNLKDIFSVIPELREIYYARYREEPNIFLVKKQKKCNSGFEIIIQNNTLDSIADRDFSLLADNNCHVSFEENKGYVFMDANYEDINLKVTTYNDIYGNSYVTNGIKVGDRFIRISKLASLYLCYYAFSMLVRYYPEKWSEFCQSSDVAIIRKLITNCKREMLVEVLQFLEGDEYYFASKLDENDEELDSKAIFDIVKMESRNEYMRTGRNPLII